MFTSRDRPRFNLRLKIIELANVPQLTGVATVRWHLTDNRRHDARGRTEIAQIRNHRAEWNYDTSMEFRMRIDSEKMLYGTSLIFDVFVESKGDRKAINTSDRNHLGRLELDLAEYAQEEPITHRYLLQKSRVNSLLNVTIHMEQLRGETDYIIPQLSTQHIFGIKSAKDPTDNFEKKGCKYHRSFARGYFVSPQGVSVNECIEDIFHGGDGFNDGGHGMFWHPPKKKTSGHKEITAKENEGPTKKTSAHKLKERLTFHKTHPNNPHTPPNPSPLHESVDPKQMERESSGMPRSTDTNAFGSGPHSSAQEPAGINIGGKKGEGQLNGMFRGYHDFETSRMTQRKKGNIVDNFVVNSAPSGYTLPRATDLLDGFISWYVVDEKTGIVEEGQNLEGAVVARKNSMEQKMMHDEFMKARVSVLVNENKARNEVETFNKTHGLEGDKKDNGVSKLLDSATVEESSKAQETKDSSTTNANSPKNAGIMPEMMYAQAIQEQAKAKKSQEKPGLEASRPHCRPTQPAGAEHSKKALAGYRRASSDASINPESKK